LLGQDLRQIVYGSYRAVYMIDEPTNTVSISHVRHGRRRRPAGEKDEPDREGTK
jgi:plasmid stabilization system protein ParE